MRQGAPPLSCRTSPPQGGRSAGVSALIPFCRYSDAYRHCLGKAWPLADLLPCGGDARQGRGGAAGRDAPEATPPLPSQPRSPPVSAPRRSRPCRSRAPAPCRW
ncbi:hypothetical protein CO648_05175 [Rhizobium phaseoli]|nr:hypothetical protein CO648_05175 [Rhizobium phaseoli]